MKLGFDVISDLNLDAESDFDWDGKATSLYLIIAGNISSELRVVHQTLLHLSKFYQGIFYIPGSLEFDSFHYVNHRYEELARLCKTMKNVAFLHKHVVIVNGVAILGVNGWYGNINDTNLSPLEQLHACASNLEDVEYLSSSLERLQLHLDVKKIILVSGSVPGPDLFFGEEPFQIAEQIPLWQCLPVDSEHKVTKWVYGNYSKNGETTIDDVTYINNSCFDQRPYWPKRIDIEL